MENAQFIALEKIVSAIPAHIYWLDKDLIYQGCNDLQAKTMRLKSSNDVVGKKNQDFTFLDPSIIDTFDRNNLEVMRTGKQGIFEEPMVLHDGKAAIMQSYKVPLIDHDKIIGLLGISFDITTKSFLAEKTRQERDEYFLALDNIIANLPGHVYWQNRNNVVLGCNELQAKSAGLRSRFEMVGKTNYDLPWKEQAEALDKINNEVMTTGREYLVEEGGPLFDGKHTTFLSKKVPMRNSQGDIVGLLGISFDITDRKNVEIELLKAKEKAEAANKAKTEFLQNMRHDFRTPFSGILGMARILHEDETDDDKKNKLNDIVQASQVLLEQLNEIADFIALEDGGLVVLEKQFDLYKTIDEVKSLLLPAAQEKQLKFIVKIDNNTPRYIIGDRVRT